MTTVPRWAFRDVVVPLGIEWQSADEAARDRACTQADKLIGDELGRLADDGWRPDDPVDMETVWLLGKMVQSERPETSVFDSATIRVKRLRPRETSSLAVSIREHAKRVGTTLLVVVVLLLGAAECIDRATCVVDTQTGVGRTLISGARCTH